MNIKLEVERILRVDHAGECGAINIYRAQIAVSRYLWPHCVPALESMLAHEQAHCLIFDAELRSRRARQCYALPLWRIGGLLLGLSTALLGPRAIWACTAAVESTVYQHIQEQIMFLEQHDEAALQAVRAIEQDEKSHLEHALAHEGTATGGNKIVWALVTACTSVAIWLSRRL